MTLGQLLLLLVGVAATAWTIARTRRSTREASDWSGARLDVELPEDVRRLVDAGEDDLAARLLAKRLGMPLGDARHVLAAAEDAPE